MTPKQILDSFSETLMRDERILSARERELLSALLQHANAASGEQVETREAVRRVISSAVGETVAQRAFAVLGASIVERIFDDARLPADGPRAEIFAGPNPGDPQPPGPVTVPKPKNPEPPGVVAPHKDPHHQPRREMDPQPPGPTRDPQPPGPMKDPQPPGQRASTTVVPETSTAVRERAEKLPARCIVLEEFLAPDELDRLTRFALEHEAGFALSEVVEPSAEAGVVDYEHRRSRVLMDLQEYQDLIVNRIKSVLPQVLSRLGMEEFDISAVEAQMTASNDGDFFRFHSDNSSDRVASRSLTFVYFFHREPRQFEGGELRLHDARLEEERYVSQGTYQTIVPEQNQIVFFPCELLHEITPVKCPSGLFADSRFTLNGWLRR